MTRDSASGKGPETDSANEVTEGTTKPVAVDTTDGEPGEVQDTTDEGALGVTRTGTDAEGAGAEKEAGAAGKSEAAQVDAGKAAEAPAAEESATPDLTLKPLPTSAGSKADDKTATPSSTMSTDTTDPASGTQAETTGADTAKAAAPAGATTPSSAAQATVPVGAATPASSGTAAPTGPATPTHTGATVTSAPEASPSSSVSDPVPPTAPKAEKHSTLVPLVGTLVALAAVAALLIGSMALPIAKGGPNKVPVGVAGTEEITGQLTTLMEQFGGEGTFSVSQFSDANELRDAIEDREVYGGLFVDNTQAQMMIATAAGIEVSDALQTVAQALQQQAQAQVTVTDVVPQPGKDQRGDGLASSELALVIAAALPAFGLIALYRRRPLAQLGGAVAASAAVGLAVAAVLTYGSGSTSGGNFWLLTVGLAAGTFATTVILLGVYALAGRIGLAIGAAVLVLLGAPLSGLSSVPEWLPDPWGTIGQILPPGATATALRSMAFFDGAGSRAALLVMGMWVVVGLLLLGLGTLLHRSNQRLADLRAEEEAARLEDEDDKAPATV
ncbi:hypothetical protein Kisp01_10560 [Kineosporia sp. NBRC 101677]|uniref:hypothetical protein n=1 Tax=Kineosporia sp. NBRC 101677 TaxID=3032197 RepID=UPI0024A2D82D|nr:hypothetical protein [Kineosporia sp. NBRC 101677]GLY14040.1 hypothetical protein Kisp01_10560 [Kineosporia sp. NBRC 101677]